jgi:MFS family permease
VKSPSIRASAPFVTAVLAFSQVANLVSAMAFPSVLPSAAAAWQLSTAEAGWVGGSLFAGYAAAVPLLSSSADRIDSRWIVLASSLLGAACSFALAYVAGGFWSATIIQFLAGVALAGVVMPAFVLLTHLVQGPRQSRCASIYSASYALGSAGSFLVAGIVSAIFGWRAVFVSGAIGPLLAAVVIPFLPRPPSHAPREGRAGGFVDALGNKCFMGFAIGFAGNTWEVFSIRVWFVACLTWTLQLPGNELTFLNPPVLSGIAALLGVPAGILVAELATTWGRAYSIVATCIVSGLVCLALALTAGGPIIPVLILLMLLQMTSFADVATLSVGAVTSVHPQRRGAAMAVYSLIGYLAGFAGSVTFGLFLGWFGGANSSTGWFAAFLMLIAGPIVTSVAVWRLRKVSPGTESDQERTQTIVRSSS